MGTSVSNVSGMNVYVYWRSTYVSSFLVAAVSAALLAFADVRWRYESATVLVTVTFHVRLFTRCYGMRVSPSGRFPSMRDSPGGSRTDGVLAIVSARCMMSLSWWCRMSWVDGVSMDRPAPRLHERPCVPLASTGAVRRGRWRDEDPQQLWLPRYRASTRMLTVGERGANHRFEVPMLSGAEFCWSCLWRPTWRRLELPLFLVCPKRFASYHIVSPMCSCCRWWSRFSWAFLGCCLLWTDSDSWAAGVTEDCGWMPRMPERRVSTSDTTRRIPRPPALNGRLASIHWGSETARLVIVQRPLLRRLSNCSRASLPKHELVHYLRCTEGWFQKGEGVVYR